MIAHDRPSQSPQTSFWTLDGLIRSFPFSLHCFRFSCPATKVAELAEGHQANEAELLTPGAHHGAIALRQVLLPNSQAVAAVPWWGSRKGCQGVETGQ